jgi:LPXTG-motif cell wall-anchored protein
VQNVGTRFSKFIGAVCLISAAVLPFAVSVDKNDDGLIFGSQASAITGGGPIVLDGMDPVCHAAYGENTDQYIAKVVKSVYDQSTMPSNTGKIAILGVSSMTSAGGCGGSWTTQLSSKFLTRFTTQPTVEFITTSSELDAFFSTGITSTPPRMLWIPDDWSRSGAINTKFTANAEKIADFVNSGGGLFASNNAYGWLTALLPSAVFNSGGCNGGPEATADGIADFGLSNTIVAACWHGYFTGNVGTLKTLVDYPYPSPTSTRKAVSIGGGSVSLPSSFTLSISPESPNAGEDLTITATAQTIAGVPQSGVSVTVTVSAGPDAGQTFTATTNASGIATITVRTNSIGSATYTATAVVSGVSKTVSATVSWNPPTTTTAAPTTTTSSTTTSTTTTIPTSTTIASTTTQVQIPSTTQVVVIPQTSLPPTTFIPPETTTTQQPIVPTTVHDHSSHSHGHLPKTGTNALSVYALAIGLFTVGLLIIAISRRKNEA